MKHEFALPLILIFILISAPARAQFSADFETGQVYSGYNDVRIPGSSGTKFSLTDDLRSEPAWFFRARTSYLFGGRHSVSALAAPLRIHASGKADRPITFRNKTFAAGTELSSRFRFDSYRLTYRYDFFRAGAFAAGAGLTAKVRDASISLEGPAGKAEKSNTGFVPLLHFKISWTPAYPVGILCEGDALAAPQGRAEDILLALQYKLNDNTTLKIGYRVLEGGADNDEVYTFSLFHYAVIGISAFL